MREGANHHSSPSVTTAVEQLSFREMNASSHTIFLPTQREPLLWRLVMWGSNEYGCAFFEEVVVNGIVTLVSAPSFTFLLYKLSQVNDAFKLRREITWVFNVTFFLTRERTANSWFTIFLTICCMAFRS